MAALDPPSRPTCGCRRRWSGALRLIAAACACIKSSFPSRPYGPAYVWRAFLPGFDSPAPLTMAGASNPLAKTFGGRNRVLGAQLRLHRGLLRRRPRLSRRARRAVSLPGQPPRTAAFLLASAASSVAVLVANGRHLVVSLPASGPRRAIAQQPYVGMLEQRPPFGSISDRDRDLPADHPVLYERRLRVMRGKVHPSPFDSGDTLY